jgi:hypothetical protein
MEICCFLSHKNWAFKYYLDTLRLRRVNCGCDVERMETERVRKQFMKGGPTYFFPRASSSFLVLPKGQEAAPCATFENSSFVSKRSRVQTSDRRPVILIEFRGFPQSLQANCGTVPYIRPRPLPTKSLPIHHHAPITISSALYSLVTETCCKINYKQKLK